MPGVARIRFTSPHPADMSEAVIDAMAECPAVMPQLHLPVQSGSDRVLGAHGARVHGRPATRRWWSGCASGCPASRSSTDVIVGFPGEDDDDFAATEALLRRVRYDSAFLFRYSSRDGTRAARWPDDVPDDEKARRLERLIALQETISAERNRALVGTDVEVLVEGPARRPAGLDERQDAPDEDRRVPRAAGPGYRW